MSDRQKAFLLIILSSIMGGGMGAFTKIGLSEIPPLSFAFTRFFLALLIVMPLLIKAKRKIIKDFAVVGPLSLFASVNIIFFTLGVKTTTATISQVLYAGVPILIGFLSYLFLKEKLGIQKTIGILIGFVGVLVVVFLPLIEQNNFFSGDLLGNMIISIGVVCWSIYMFASKKLQKTHSPFIIVGIFIILTTLILFPFFLLDLKTNYGWWIHLSFNSLVSMFYVVFIGTIGSYLLGQYAIKHGGTVFASMTFYIQPIFAFLIAYLTLGERLTLGIFVGGLLALLGVFFTTKR